MAAMAKGRGRSGRRRAVAEINVVPYIDVMLVLLIIFMVTAPMLQQGIEVNTPQVAGAGTSEPPVPPLLITVEKDGKLSIDKVRMTTEQVQIRLAEHHELNKQRPLNKQAPVLVDGDSEASYLSVLTALAQAKASGVESVMLVTKSLPHSPKASGK
jgi:biopolymer transport protein TolR